MIYHYQHQAWAWLKAELVRRLGAETVAEIWAEYTRLARIDHLHARRQRCAQQIALAGDNAPRLATLRAELAQIEAKITEVTS